MCQADMMISVLRRTLLPFMCVLAVFVTACSPRDPEAADIKWKQSLSQRLHENLSLPLAERVQQMPADLLKITRDYDRSLGIANTEHYAARVPSADELALIKSYLALLPQAHQSVFAKKLLAVYLVDGFAGAGMSDWVVDREGHIYYYLILNSALFTTSIDDWLSYKDNSAFDHSSAAPMIRIKTQTNYQALLYGLLHEGAHIVDYELGVTPYVDQPHRRLSGRTGERTAFTDGVWMQQSQPDARFDFKHRGDLNTYGIFPKRGLIPRAELAGMFSQLSQTPFVSFYSGTSWNEDLADYVTYRQIERKLGGAITVELLSAGKMQDRYTPLATQWAKQREKTVRVFDD